MNNSRQGCRAAGRIRAFAAALLAAFILVMPAAAATVTGDDVVIRNTPEDRGQENSIGSLNSGDTVTVLESTKDASGTEWYKVELPNKNQGYVKAQWVDNGGQTPEKAQQEETQEEEAPQAGEDQVEDQKADDAGDEETDEGFDDGWTQEDPQMAAGTEAEAPVETEEQEGADKDTDKEAGSPAASQEEPEADKGDAYDPYTDPDAHYSIHFYSENDGSGEWYVYNYETDSRIRIGDLEELSSANTAAQKSASAAGIWRTAACILLILLVILLILLYMIIKRNSPGPRRPSSRRSRKRILSDGEDELETEPEEDQTLEEEELMEEALEGAASPAAVDLMAVEAGERFRAAGYKEALEEETEEEDDPEADDADEDESDGDYSDEDLFGEDDDLDDDYLGEEDIEEDDLSEPLPSPKKGGFLGFLKNIFSPDGLSDEFSDEDEDDIEYTGEGDEEYSEDDEDGKELDEDEPYGDGEEEEEPQTAADSRRGGDRSGRSPRPRPRKTPNIEFDEELDYPEDAELLSFGSSAQAGQKQTGSEEAEATVSGGIRQEAASTSSQERREAGRDIYADEDDDMEYSFLAGSSKRSR